MAMLKVPVVKGKGTVEIDTDKLPVEIYKAALEAGLKALVNGGTSKITKETYPDEAKLKEAAMAKADERVTQMLDGTLKLPGKKAAGKASGKVMTEARRLAKAHVKDMIRENGGKISHYDAKTITAAANELLETMPELIEQAEKNLAERDAVPVAGKIDLSAIMKVNPEKVKKAEEAAAKKKANKPLSAKQAGMTAKKKPGASKAPAAAPAQ